MNILDMDEVNRKRCLSCDFYNNDVPISEKKPKCRTMERIGRCEIAGKTLSLQNRIMYLKGEISPTFICGSDGCYVDFYDGGE